MTNFYFLLQDLLGLFQDIDKMVFFRKSLASHQTTSNSSLNAHEDYISENKQSVWSSLTVLCLEGQMKAAATYQSELRLVSVLQL